MIWVKKLVKKLLQAILNKKLGFFCYVLMINLTREEEKGWGGKRDEKKKKMIEKWPNAIFDSSIRDFLLLAQSSVMYVSAIGILGIGGATI